VKKAVSDLANKGGFEAVEAGPLSNAPFIEPLDELKIQMGFFLGRGTSVAPIWIDAQAEQHRR
jgi:8-hydroxy-5-deazaflavin:NADPH oxidoreductase